MKIVYRLSLLCFIILMMRYEGRGHDNEKSVNTTYSLVGPNNYTKNNSVWLGIDIGQPGLVNANSGIFISSIGIQGKIGLIYPYYKTAEVSLFIEDKKIIGRENGWDIKFGYLEHDDDIYRYIGAGIKKIPINDNFGVSLGLMYFLNNTDILYPVIPYFSIGYHFNHSW